MTYHDGGGHVLRLWADQANPPPSERSWLWIAYNAQCEICWHKTHRHPVSSCLLCRPAWLEAA